MSLRQTTHDPRVQAFMLLVPALAIYAIFALCLFLPKAWRLASLLGVLGLLSALGPFVQKGGPAAFYTDTLLLEFAAGIVIAQLWLRGFRLPPLITIWS